MQFTTKFAVLAAAIATALAVPLVSRDVDYEIEAREIDSDLSAREFYEAYLNARADPALNARDLESMDLEAREYLEYLEARDTAFAPAQTPLTPDTATAAKPSKVVALDETPAKTPSTEGGTTQAGTQTPPTADALTEAKPSKVAALDETGTKGGKTQGFESGETSAESHGASEDRDEVKGGEKKHKKSHRHRHQSHSANKKAYLKKHFKAALLNRKNKYHKEAVKVYFSDSARLNHALRHPNNKYHQLALQYVNHLGHKHRNHAAGAESHAAKPEVAEVKESHAASSKTAMGSPEAVKGDEGSDTGTASGASPIAAPASEGSSAPKLARRFF